MSTDSPPRATPSEVAFAELAKINADRPPLNEVLARTVELAKSVIRVPVEASVTLINSEAATTPVFTSQVAADLDDTQYQLGSGPCLASAEAGQLVSTPNMAEDNRWPQFSSDAQANGIHSSLSIPLPVQRQVIGALNMYSPQAYSFGEDVIEIAAKFGTYAAVTVAHTTLYLSASDLAEQMLHAMQSRAVIEQAKGIIMGEHRCDADEAFNILVGLSQHGHRKLRDVAKTLVERTHAP
jgi:GAF domain-containing protein